MGNLGILNLEGVCDFYKNDKKDGYGEYTFADGKKYTGLFKNNKQHGIGIFISPKGRKKYGIWNEGSR